MLVGLGLFERVQVGALDVFDQRQFEVLAVAGLAHDDWHLFQAGLPGGLQTTFPCDQDKAAAARR